MFMTQLSRLVPLLAISMMVAGCDLIGDVLEFGFWTIVILVLIIVGLIWLVSKSLGRNRRNPPPPGGPPPGNPPPRT